MKMHFNFQNFSPLRFPRQITWSNTCCYHIKMFPFFKIWWYLVWPPADDLMNEYKIKKWVPLGLGHIKRSLRIKIPFRACTKSSYSVDRVTNWNFNLIEFFWSFLTKTKGRKSYFIKKWIHVLYQFGVTTKLHFGQILCLQIFKVEYLVSYFL